MKKRIEMTFDEVGGLTIEAFGYTGNECRLATEPFEQAAGTVKERKAKAEAGLAAVTKKVRAK